MKHINSVILALIISIIMTGCNGPEPEPGPLTGITVTTLEVTNVTSVSAMCGGWVSASSGAVPVNELGICWSTEAEPTIESDRSSTEVWYELFETSMDSLLPNTTYHVRAYAVQGTEVHYGEERCFTTGILPPLEGFYISPTRRVKFAPGNLQYRASTATWRFAENQWDCLRQSNAHIGQDYDGWIDLFGWGTGGNPTYVSDQYLSPYQTFADWGVNAISNGGGQPNLWRTLTKDEWNYVVFERPTPSGARYAKANVNGVNGVILLPNNWNTSSYGLNGVNTPDGEYAANTVTETQWSGLEEQGCVFLPAAGVRDVTWVFPTENEGDYWTSTAIGDICAHYFDFWGSNVTMGNQFVYRGLSVRLAIPCED